MVAVMF